jgi:hypothetical protein
MFIWFQNIIIQLNYGEVKFAITLNPDKCQWISESRGSNGKWHSVTSEVSEEIKHPQSRSDGRPKSQPDL